MILILLIACGNFKIGLKTPPVTPLFPSLEMETKNAHELVVQRELSIILPLSRAKLILRCMQVFVSLMKFGNAHESQNQLQVSFHFFKLVQSKPIASFLVIRKGILYMEDGASWGIS
nr:hypothetical protein [Tanacetum cinerariifolium]